MDPLVVSASMDGHAVIWDCHATFRSPSTIFKKFHFIHDSNIDIDNPDASVAKMTAQLMVSTLAKWLSAMPNGPALPPALSFGLLLETVQGRLAIVEGRSGLRLRRLRGRPGRPVLMRPFFWSMESLLLPLMTVSFPFINYK